MERKLTNDNQAKPSPARSRSKAKDGAASPVIVVDTREQRPLSEYFTLPFEIGTLQTGDYSLKGAETLVALERKSIDDLIGCLMGDGRTRFEKELARARAYDYFALVIEGDMATLASGGYRSQMNPAAVLQSLFAFSVRYRLPVFFCPGRRYAARTIESLLAKWATEQERRFKALVRGPVPVDLPGVVDPAEPTAVNQ